MNRQRSEVAIEEIISQEIYSSAVYELSFRENLGRLASTLTFGAMAIGGGPLGMAWFLFNQTPLWRVPGRPDKGVALMDYAYEMFSEVEVPHIDIEQARHEAWYIYERRRTSHDR